MATRSRPDRNLQVVRDGGHQGDTLLKAACRAVAEPHYASLGSLFERDWSFCDTAYLAWRAGELAGFFLTRNHRVPSVGPAIFCGLSAGAGLRSANVAVIELYGLMLTEAAQNPRRPLVWGTTISPIVFHAVAEYLHDVAPSEVITDEQKSIAHALVEDRESWGWRLPSGNPFALHGLSPDVRYSSAMIERMRQLERRSAIFQVLNLREDRGDRLLFIGRARKGFRRLARSA